MLSDVTQLGSTAFVLDFIAFSLKHSVKDQEGTHRTVLWDL